MGLSKRGGNNADGKHSDNEFAHRHHNLEHSGNTGGAGKSWPHDSDQTEVWSSFDERLDSEIPMIGMDDYDLRESTDVYSADSTQAFAPAVASPQGGGAGGMTHLAPSLSSSAPKGRPNLKRNILIAVGAVLGVVLIAYIGMSVFFMSHFGFNTQIAGIDCSLKSASEVEELLEDKAGSYELAIYERTSDEASQVASTSNSSKTDSSQSASSNSGGDSSGSDASEGASEPNSAQSATTGVTGSHVENVEGSKIDLEYKGGNGEVQGILDSQNSFAWIARLFAKDDSSSKVTFSYDKEKLHEAMSKLACMDNSNAVEPKDAYPEFDGSHYVVHNEIPGNKVDVEKAQQAISEAVSHAEPKLDLSSAGCYFSPAVVSTSADLQERVKLLDKYVPFALTYTFTDGSTEILDGATIFDWLTINDDGSYTVDEEKVASWVAEFASRHTTVGHERSFTSVDGNTYTVSGGTYGWSVDQDAEIESIESMLETKQSETREPHWGSKAAVSDATGTQPDWGSTYIELNLSAQHMYFVRDGHMVFEADVVTGLPTPKRETPAGVYSVLEKQRNKTLRGETNAEGVPEYETPVAYWIRMTWTGVGFHDATWQSSFGGSAYQTRGSHGCINMSLSDVSQLYDLVETGTPIVSHY